MPTPASRLFRCVLPGLALGAALALSACGKDEAEAPPRAPAATVAAPETPPAAAPSAAKAAPALVFTPRDFEVRQAMQQLLVQKAMALPASPQRDAWFAAESARLGALPVDKCTTTPIGTPSVCQVSVGGKAVQVRILLTRAGWMLVK